MSTVANAAKKRKISENGGFVETQQATDARQSAMTKRVPLVPTVEHFVHLDPFAPRASIVAATTTTTSATLSAISNGDAGPSTIAIQTETAAAQKLPETSRAAKLAFYDLDGTLITPKGHNKFPNSENDWRWWDPSVKRKLMEIYSDGFDVVIISNQSLSPKSLEQWRRKIPLVCQDLPAGLPVRVLAATAKDGYRKPMDGMFKLVQQIYREHGMEIDRGSSFFVGDAAGRPRRGNRERDHSDTDLKWALNVGIQFYTPEQHFQGLLDDVERHLQGFNASAWLDTQAPLVRSTKTPLIPRDTREVVLFVGFPASGKTTLFNRYFRPNGYVHINQDKLKTRDACLKKVREVLELTKSGCVVDNTNRDKDTRKLYIDIAKHYRVPIRCFHFTAPQELAEHNNKYRAYVAPEIGNLKRREVLPALAFKSFAERFEKPSKDEGFTDVKEVTFKFEGSEDERELWAKWTT